MLKYLKKVYLMGIVSYLRNPGWYAGEVAHESNTDTLKEDSFKWWMSET